MSLKKYRIWCSTDSKYEYRWTEGIEPTTCPENTSHTIDVSKTRIVDNRKDSLVKIDENKGGLGGFYKTKNCCLYIPTSHQITGALTAQVTAGSSLITVDQATIDAIDIDDILCLYDGTTTGLLGKTTMINRVSKEVQLSKELTQQFEVGTNIQLITTSEDFIQNIDIGVLSFSFISSEDNNGDGMDVIVYPNTVIGAVTTNVSTGSTVLDVSSTVIENINVGFWCMLDNGAIVENRGEVISVDTVNSQITVSESAVTAFPAGTYVKINIKMAEVCDIGPAGPHQEGMEKIGSSQILKDKAVRIKYHNNSGGGKKFCFYVGMLY